MHRPITIVANLLMHVLRCGLIPLEQIQLDTCKTVNCQAMINAVCHIVECRKNQSCRAPYCISIRHILLHIRFCLDPTTCGTCQIIWSKRVVRKGDRFVVNYRCYHAAILMKLYVNVFAKEIKSKRVELATSEIAMMLHACQCIDPDCDNEYCNIYRRAAYHVRECEGDLGATKECRESFDAFIVHAKICRDKECNIRYVYERCIRL